MNIYIFMARANRSVVYMFGEFEHFLSRAEILYKGGKTEEAIVNATRALELCRRSRQKTISLKIFLAKCYAKLGDVEQSNKLYRELIDMDVYLPPVIMGLMHNNLSSERDEKAKRNLDLMKIFLSKGGKS